MTYKEYRETCLKAGLQFEIKDYCTVPQTFEW